MFEPDIAPARLWIGRALFMLVALGAGMTSWATLATLDGLPRTDDARVSAETVHLPPASRAGSSA